MKEGGDARGDTVRGGGIQRITDDNTCTDGDDINVERVVDEVHVVGCREWPRCAVHGAREREVRLRERCFPDHLELGQDVIDRPVRAVRACVEKDDHAGLCGDEGA